MGLVAGGGSSGRPRSGIRGFGRVWAHGLGGVNFELAAWARGGSWVVGQGFDRLRLGRSAGVVRRSAELVEGELGMRFLHQLWRAFTRERRLLLEFWSGPRGASRILVTEASTALQF